MRLSQNEVCALLLELAQAQSKNASCSIYVECMACTIANVVVCLLRVAESAGQSNSTYNKKLYCTSFLKRLESFFLSESQHLLYMCGCFVEFNNYIYIYIYPEICVLLIAVYKELEKKTDQSKKC